MGAEERHDVIGVGVGPANISLAIALDESTHIANLTGGVHAEQKPDRSFDAIQVLYNTVTEDFKALGGVRMQFPANQAAPAPSASPRPSAPPGGKPTNAPTAAPTGKPAATPTPAPTPARSE